MNNEQTKEQFIKDFRDWRFKEDRELSSSEIVNWSSDWWLTHHRQAFEKVEKELEALKGKFSSANQVVDEKTANLINDIADKVLDDALAIMREEI